MGFWKQLIVSALLIGGATGAWMQQDRIAGFWSAAEAERNASDGAGVSRATPVIVAEVETARDDLTFSAIGTGFAVRSITLRAPSGGEIKALDIAPGRSFAEGEVVMRLDDRDERLAVSLAEVRLERATSERDRYRTLQDTGAAATARFEEAQTDFKMARIELEQARAALADRVLRAPFDGVAGLASVETGDRIAADAPISSFDDRSRTLVEFDLPEALLGRVAPGLPVSARTPAVPGRSFEGEVVAIDSRVEAETRTARVRAAIDNRSDLLRPGASFSLRLDLPGGSFPAVPELALQFSQGALNVWRVADGAVERVEVQLVRRREGLVLLEGPLNAGDAVVLEGTQRLRPGVNVEVLNDTSAGNS